MMNSEDKSNKKLVLTNAIVWAMMILGTALLLGDEISKAAQNNMLIMHIVGWTIIHSAIDGTRTAAEEWRCIKNIFSRSKS